MILYTFACAVSRLLHLSKLLMLFQFNDFGAWFSFSRWCLGNTDTAARRICNRLQQTICTSYNVGRFSFRFAFVCHVYEAFFNTTRTTRCVS